MEELQALPVVKGVEVDPEIEIHGQYGAYFPGRSRQQRSPEIGAAAQGFGGSPVAKICGSRRMRFSLGSRSRIDNSDREGLLSQNGDRPLDHLASAWLPWLPRVPCLCACFSRPTSSPRVSIASLPSHLSHS